MADQLGGASGNATAADLLTGYTASVASGPISGTMPNQGAVTLTPSGTGTVAIPAGYHNGSGVVSQVSVPAANVLSGTTIAGVAGTMTNNGNGSTITPGTSTKTIASGYWATANTVSGDANLIAANILSGKTIFGVAGSVIAGTPYASGTATSTTTQSSFNLAASAGTQPMYSVTVSGLTFTPALIVIDGAWINGYDADVTIYDSSKTFYSSDANAKILNITANANQYQGHYTVTSPAVISSTGFTLPVYESGATYTWHAYGNT